MIKVSKSKIAGAALAVGVAGIMALTPVVASAASHQMVKCYGVNACKGKGSCKSANNACKGKNSCKGQGFVGMSQMQCEQVGGKMG